MKLSLTSNGYTIDASSDETLRSFREVEVSIDFPTEAEQDAFRGPGNWQRVMAAMARAQRLGVTVTVLSVMMKTNYRRLPEIAAVAFGAGANYRVNVYQPVKTDAFTLTYEEYWEGFRRLLAATRLVNTTEPVLNAMLGAPFANGSGCGRQTVRVTPQGDVIPCVYWGGPISPSPTSRSARGGGRARLAGVRPGAHASGRLPELPVRGHLPRAAARAGASWRARSTRPIPTAPWCAASASISSGHRPSGATSSRPGAPAPPSSRRARAVADPVALTHRILARHDPGADEGRPHHSGARRGRGDRRARAAGAARTASSRSSWSTTARPTRRRARRRGRGRAW